MCEEESSPWYLFGEVKVKKLSSEPDIPEKLFGILGGPVYLRVCAVNRAGRGVCAEQIVHLTGKNKNKTVFKTMMTQHKYIVGLLPEQIFHLNKIAQN